MGPLEEKNNCKKSNLGPGRWGKEGGAGGYGQGESGGLEPPGRKD